MARVRAGVSVRGRIRVIARLGSGLDVLLLAELLRDGGATLTLTLTLTLTEALTLTLTPTLRFTELLRDGGTQLERHRVHL